MSPLSVIFPFIFRIWKRIEKKCYKLCGPSIPTPYPIFFCPMCSLDLSFKEESSMYLVSLMPESEETRVKSLPHPQASPSLGKGTWTQPVGVYWERCNYCCLHLRLPCHLVVNIYWVFLSYHALYEALVLSKPHNTFRLATTIICISQLRKPRGEGSLPCPRLFNSWGVEIWSPALTTGVWCHYAYVL